MSKDSSTWEELIRETSGDVRRLSSVWRYSSIPISVPENVAEHSYWVAMYGALLHQSMGGSNDVLGTVVLRGLLHDLGECVTGDVVRTFKYSTDELKREVDRAEEILVRRLPKPVQKLEHLSRSIVMTDYDKEWGEYVEAVVKAADFMSLFQFMRREAARGNMEIIPFYNRMILDLSIMEDKAPVLKFVGSGFPGPFYRALGLEARKVLSDCFKGMENNPRWTRQV